MSFSRTTIVAAVAAILALAVNISFAEVTFRGIATASSKDLQSGVFDSFLPRHNGIFNTDMRDDFTGRSGGLAGTEVDGTLLDGTRIGFVPPVDTTGGSGASLQGPLPPALAAQHGTWMGHAGYSVDGGRASLTSADQPGVACLPWRVTDDLGNFYLLDATADVADGETVSIGYFGEVATTGAAATLADDLGLLVLNLSRTGNTIDWEVKWEGEIPGSLNGTAGEFAMGEDVNMQLGWMDNGGPGVGDLFEAQINNTQLVAGDMGVVPSLGVNGVIDVFGVGFELSGTESSFGSFAAAVPEPTSGLLGLMSVIGLLTLRRRRS